MGTNYYLETPESEACPHCGRAEETKTLHIGKSSGGWCFSLHVYPENDINDLSDWQEKWITGTIKDEYGRVIHPLEMNNIVTVRRWEAGKLSRKWLEENGASQGPNGLARHRLGTSCISHGVGTWDCITGDFS